MKDLRKLAEELLIKIYEPESKDCQTQKEDLQLAITLNPSVERIIDAMLSFHEKASKDMYPKEFVDWAIRKQNLIWSGIYEEWQTSYAGNYHSLDDLFTYFKDNIKHYSFD